LQAAIAFAQSQKARSFELRAALSLAKLYRVANRDADVLAPAVEGAGSTDRAASQRAVSRRVGVVGMPTSWSWVPRGRRIAKAACADV